MISKRHYAKQLRKAIENNNILKVKEHINNGGAFVLSYDNFEPGTGHHEVSLIAEAAYWGHIEIVRLLIDSGADVNASSPTEGYGTALTAASLNSHLPSHLPICQLLLQHGANVNANDGVGYNAVLNAAACGNLELVQLLIQAQANVALVVRNDRECTSLMKAIINRRDPKIIHALLNAGADIIVNVKDNRGNTALLLASNFGQAENVARLIEAKAEINLQNNDGNTPLIVAASGGYTEIVEDLLQHRANVNLRNKQNHSASMEAASKGHKELAKYLQQYENKTSDIATTKNESTFLPSNGLFSKENKPEKNQDSNDNLLKITYPGQ